MRAPVAADVRAQIEMLEIVFDFLTEVVFFHLGKLYLAVVTLGRYKPKINDTSQPLVTLFGAIVTIGLLVGIVAWISRS